MTTDHARVQKRPSRMPMIQENLRERVQAILAPLVAARARKREHVSRTRIPSVTVAARENSPAARILERLAMVAGEFFVSNGYLCEHSVGTHFCLLSFTIVATTSKHAVQMRIILQLICAIRIHKFVPIVKRLEMYEREKKRPEKGKGNAVDDRWLLELDVRDS